MVNVSHASESEIACKPKDDKTKKRRADECLATAKCLT